MRIASLYNDNNNNIYEKSVFVFEVCEKFLPWHSKTDVQIRISPKIYPAKLI